MVYESSFHGERGGGGGSGYIIYPRKKNELLAVVGLFAMQPEG